MRITPCLAILSAMIFSGLFTLEIGVLQMNMVAFIAQNPPWIFTYLMIFNIVLAVGGAQGLIEIFEC